MITTLPFKILNIDGEGFHLLVKTHINGKPAKLIVDTGASKTVFDKKRILKFVSDKKFKIHDKLSTGLGTNSMESHIVILKKMKLGDLEISNYTTVLLDLSHVNKSYKEVGFAPVEGVLGGDILLKYKAVIDYEKKVLKLKYKL